MIKGGFYKMRMKKLKRFMTAVMAAALVFGVGKTPVFAEGESDFEVTNLIKEFTGTGAYDYVGYVSLNGAPADSKYLELTYTGNVTYLRLEFEDKDQEAKKTVWFDKNQADHFVTTDDSDIPLDVAEDTDIVIDLEKSGVDISKYAVEGGLHIHYGDGALTDGTFHIKAAKLTGGKATSTPDEKTDDQTKPEEPQVDSKGEFPLDKMNKTLKASATGGYNYNGWVSFDGAPAESKYLEFDYTGDITTLRIQIEPVPGDGVVGKDLWFAPGHEDDKNAVLVNANDGDFPLTGGSIKVDLAASGIDLAAIVTGQGGIHLQYGDDTEPNPGVTATITNARLTGSAVAVDTPEPEPQPAQDPAAQEPAAQTPAAQTSAADTKKDEPKKEEPKKAPKTGDTTAVAATSLLALGAAAGIVCLKKKRA